MAAPGDFNQVTKTTTAIITAVEAGTFILEVTMFTSTA
jgi:hypothetical protein